MTRRKQTTYGFKQTSALINDRVRDVTGSRGFAQARLLTHWEEVVGPDIAKMTRPVTVSFAKGGFGATLVVLTTGAYAPMVSMQAETIRNRANAVYGYNAIARVKFTQTAPTGFAEGQAVFDHAGVKHRPKQITRETQERAQKVAEGVGDDGLRLALERLACHVISKSTKNTT